MNSFPDRGAPNEKGPRGCGVHIHTIGCQMNVYDSGRMAAFLAEAGYTEEPDADEADVIIVNTCAIREKAVQKMASFIGRFAEAKRRHPGKRLVVAGCVAQQEGKRLLARFPYVDIVVGTRAFQSLPEMLEKASAGRGPLVDTRMAGEAGASDSGSSNGFFRTAVSDFVTVMRGCDNFCTYCVVPFVRGREKSRPPEHVLDEIRARVAAGMREVTLLGQNVNSYGMKEGLSGFAELLAKVDAVDGLQRIRFVTSHPKDISPELIEAFAHLEKLCRHIHLPVQSGSDRVLKRMNRGYTAGEYLEKIRRLRDAAPDIAISTDIIAGFPGETDADFRKTLELMETVAYDSLFAFAYSDRPNAPARRFGDKVAEPVKNERLQKVFSLQERISGRKQAAQVGSRLEVLVEGESRRQQKAANRPGGASAELTGRSPDNRVVNFLLPPEWGLDIKDVKGQIIPVKIEKAFSNSLWGIAEASESAFSPSKGGCVYVA